jgi:hypothetical protein
MNKHRNHDEQYISPPNQAVNLTIPELWAVPALDVAPIVLHMANVKVQ